MNLQTLRVGPNRFVKNGGFVLLLIVLSMVGILGALFVTGLASSGNNSARRATTAVALAKAKEALIAYALTSDAFIATNGRPGQFPCPSTVSPTATTNGTAAGTCATTPRIGRLPWKTLGIEELYDSTGEPLWYALSNNFRPPVTAGKINSDTLGDLTIHDVGGTAVLANQVVAVVFSAGAPVSGQNRTSTTSFCATTSTTIAGNRCATNYLDISFGRNNATNAGPYIADRPNATFNDQLVYITTADFIPKIEERIVTILKQSVKDYYVTNGYYPYAANYADFATPLTLNCANGVFSGRFPIQILAAPQTGATCTGLAEWSSSSFPPWFSVQEWHVGVHYAIGREFNKGGTKVCGPVGDCLAVDADFAVQAIFVLPGIPTPTQSRPSGNPASYLETSANLDEWPTPVNYTYATTTSPLPSRDRVVAIKN